MIMKLMNKDSTTYIFVGQDDPISEYNKKII